MLQSAVEACCPSINKHFTILYRIREIIAINFFGVGNIIISTDFVNAIFYHRFGVQFKIAPPLIVTTTLFIISPIKAETSVW